MSRPFILGFSGTRRGMSRDQWLTLMLVLPSLDPKPDQFWHGDCVGADVQFHDAVLRNFGGHAHIELWPSNLRSRARCDILYSFPGSRYTIHPPGNAADRTRFIARSSKVLIATPLADESQSPGTWLAIKTAVSAKKQVIIIWPDGHTEDR